MQVSNSVYKPNFGRAFTTKEKEDYKTLLRDSKKVLGIKDTGAIVFDFNVPSEKGYNTGIGSTFSDSMNNFSNFLKDMTGITSVQLAPQGKITYGNTSPYSGTNYAFGDHIIDLKKLTERSYAQLLSEEDVKRLDREYFGDKVTREYRTDYENVIGTDHTVGTQERLLQKAFQNFGFSMSVYDEDAAKLNIEFKNFKENNKSWLEPETVYTVLTEEYGTNDYNQWCEEDRELYNATVTSEETRKQRINQLKQQYSSTFEYESFKQFIADKQQKESRKSLNDEGIKVYGDCLLGFSRSEIWAHKDCFKDNLFYGGPDPNCTETNGIQTWGLNALDYNQLGVCNEQSDLSELGASGKLLYDKYSKFFERYDGIRMDAAWQFVTPFIYKEKDNTFKKVETPEINDTILNIMKKAAKNTFGRNFDLLNPENIMLELVGLSADKSRELTRNTFPHLYTTTYAEYGENPAQLEKSGYKRGKYYTGTGNHDNASLVEQARDKEKRKTHLNGIRHNYKINLAKLNFKDAEYNSQTQEQKRQENFRNAKFAEIFTTAKQFFTLPDMFGMGERINISGKASTENWRVRIPCNYEEFYFSQLSKGFGLNVPKAYENALYMRHIDNPELMSKLSEAAEILRNAGPMTEEAANEADNRGELQNKFRYNG